MCQQCESNPIVYAKKIGPYTLMRATKNSWEPPGDGDWKAGEFGLVIQNNPTFRFSTMPVAVRPEWLTPDWMPEDGSPEEDLWVEAVHVATTIEDEILSNTFPSLRRSVQLANAVVPSVDEIARYDVSLCLMKSLYEAIQSGVVDDSQD